MTAPWRALVLEAPAGLGDEIAAALAEQALGAHLEDAAAGRSTIRVYLDARADPERWRVRARSVLSAHGLPGADVRIEVVEDGRWAERWNATLAPLPLGERFVVLPRAELEADPGRRPIRLTPGMAFGTGEHPTTRLCASALEEVVRRGERWVDVGTGTGILALVARFSGAAEVVALDSDPEAVRVATETVAGNGEGDAVSVRRGTVGDSRDLPFDGAVANIAASFFLREAGALAAALRSGGTLVAAGFLEDDLPEVEAALSRAGFRQITRGNEGAWARIVGRSAER